MENSRQLYAKIKSYEASKFKNGSHIVCEKVPFCKSGHILYFVWEDQYNVAHCIVHSVLISCITVLYESYRTILQLIGQIQYSYVLNLANTAHLGECSTVMRRIYLRNVTKATYWDSSCLTL